MKIVKDTSKQYQDKINKEKMESEKRKKEYEDFIHPKSILFKCTDCNTHYELEYHEFKKNNKASLRVETYCDSNHTYTETLIAMANCPTCETNNIITKIKYSKPWYQRLLLSFKSFLEELLDLMCD